MTRDDINSLAHSKWNCKYHVVFVPKYRRMVIYHRIKEDIGRILRKLCEQKGIEIIEAELCPDHIHMLIAIPPKYSVAQIIPRQKASAHIKRSQGFLERQKCSERTGKHTVHFSGSVK